MSIERRSKHEYVVPGSISPVRIPSSLNQFPSRFQYMKASRGVAPVSSTGRLIRSISGTKCRATRLRPRPTTPLLPPHNQSSYTKTTSGEAALLNQPHQHQEISPASSLTIIRCSLSASLLLISKLTFYSDPKTNIYPALSSSLYLILPKPGLEKLNMVLK